MLSLRHLAESDRFADVMRVLLALTGIALWCTLAGPAEAIVPALLGAIACALAETDDAWRGRLRGLIVTLLCFALAAAAVKACIGTPPLFAILLPVGTFLLVMLGAASGRYATIATATLILSVYTMIATDSAGAAAGGWHGTLAILAGAAWYGSLSLLWSALAPQRAVRHALARLFESLAALIEAKAALFEPVRGLDRDALHIEFSKRNLRTVEALTAARIALLDRIGRRQPRGRSAARLGMFFVAQDIHERISSSHYPYDELAGALYHSDLMFRFGRLLRLQAIACRERADAIREVAPLRSIALPRAALDDLREALAYRRRSDPPDEAIDDALSALLSNMDRLQAGIEDEGSLREDADISLQGNEPASIREALARVRLRLNRRSMHFRHAMRLAIGMLAGYALMLGLHPTHGYWILLTTLFVCQPSYGATRRRMVQRIAGTTAGLVVGWALLRLLPPGDWRLPVLVATGAAFFAFRLRRYALATGVITLFVLLCFDRVGAGYDAIGPRLLDTLLGAVVAAAAIRFVLPDWRVRRLDDIVADALLAYGRYLERIADQYAHGKVDDLPYRIARRDAHAAQAAVAGNVAELLGEPGHSRDLGERALRLLTALQAGLSHLSTLGAHRQSLPADDALALQALARHITHGFDALAGHIRTGTVAPPLGTPALLVGTSMRVTLGAETVRLVDRQCLLLIRVHDRIAAIPKA
ncbi:MAG: YccS family putative transporter [Luteibacter sp.]|uniref:YccS family putative transporter n=1 Tax=Luteibacter sp. TaxID=1886636 RepID=UPI002809227A|nr:YccS family putative transporter [Luteibacter sp.]MDQ7996038.1 YccS family putative transporter [Luteibacter sp.]MDQ8048803.1 YccS family putative transporter [Luteibacter sp.]